MQPSFARFFLLSILEDKDVSREGGGGIVRNGSIQFVRLEAE
jgi:hypothetical protein